MSACPEAKNCTFFRNGLIVLAACCGDKVHIPKEKFDFGNFLLVCFLLNEVLINFEVDKIGKFGGEKAHIPKEKNDFASCLLRRKSVHSGREKNAHSEGNV